MNELTDEHTPTTRPTTSPTTSPTTLPTTRRSTQAEHMGGTLAPQGTRGPVVVVASPHAGHAVGMDQLVRQLEAAGVAVGKQTIVSELYEHQPEGLRWRDAGYSAVVAAGGDGTIGTVATHLAGSGLPLGIVPLGTANDVARSLRIPLDSAAACRVIAHGVPTPVDAGQALPALTKPGALATDATALPSGADAPTPASGAYFLHALTLGLNVAFARLATDVARRRRWGHLTYATSALEALKGFRPIPVTLRLSPERAGDDEIVVECNAVQVVAVNTPVFGGAMNLRVPGVRDQDRLLDMLVIEALESHSLRATIEGLLAALSRLAGDVRDHLSAGPDERSDEALGFALPGVRRLKASSVHIKTPEPMDVTMDGEVRAHTPILVRIAPEPVHIFLPANSGDMPSGDMPSVAAGLEDAK